MSIFEQVKYKLFGVSDFGGELINRPGGEALLLKKGSGGLLVEEGDLKRVEEKGVWTEEGKGRRAWWLLGIGFGRAELRKMNVGEEYNYGAKPAV